MLEAPPAAKWKQLAVEETNEPQAHLINDCSHANMQTATSVLSYFRKMFVLHDFYSLVYAFCQALELQRGSSLPLRE